MTDQLPPGEGPAPSVGTAQAATDQPVEPAGGESGGLSGDGSSTPGEPRRHGFSRRGVLAAAGVGVVGAAAGSGITYAATRRPPVAPVRQNVEQVIRHNYSPHGKHQAGIITPTPAVTRLVALDLLDAITAATLAKLMKLWSGDIDALMAGRAAPGDPLPDLAQTSVSLTVTAGFGPRIFRLPGVAAGAAPQGFVDIPPMTHDALQTRWTGGDLVLLIAADDPTTVAYASRVLIRDAATFATVRWVQDGSWRGTNANGDLVTGRNLFGQMDGTANPVGADLESTIWAADPQSWFDGGTTLVVRRIEMNLDTWEAATRDRQEKALGRRFSDGAPLGGNAQRDTPNFDAKDLAGNPVIPLDAHVRLAHQTQNNGRQLLRRSVNYTYQDAADGGWRQSSGLIFLSFQANVANQFVPIQRALDAGDALNEWTTAIGSAVFAIPPGFATDSYLGKALLG